MHEALPQTLTVENLAQWLTDNRVDTTTVKGTKIITDEERSEYEHISSDCSQKLDELEETKKLFSDYLNNGTYNPEVDEPNGKIITIPSTVGVKKLTEERKRVDKLLRDGHTVEKTLLYIIPWPEEKRMVAFDILGQEWDDFSRDMREDEINKHRTLFESAPVQLALDGPADDVDMPAQEEEPIIAEELIVETPKRKKRGSASDNGEPII